MILFAEGSVVMRLLLLVMVVALGVDAYAYSGAYTQATVNEVSRGVHRLTSNISKKSEPPAPQRATPERQAPTS
jgi:hypothetical protein